MIVVIHVSLKPEDLKAFSELMMTGNELPEFMASVNQNVADAMFTAAGVTPIKMSCELAPYEHHYELEASTHAHTTVISSEVNAGDVMPGASVVGLDLTVIE